MICIESRDVLDMKHQSRCAKIFSINGGGVAALCQEYESGFEYADLLKFSAYSALENLNCLTLYLCRKEASYTTNEDLR